MKNVNIFLLTLLFLSSCATNKKGSVNKGRNSSEYGDQYAENNEYEYDDEFEFDDTIGQDLDDSKVMFKPISKYYAVLNVGNEVMNKAARFVKRKQFKKAHAVLNNLLKERKNRGGVYYYKFYIYILEKKYELAKFLAEKIKKRKVYEYGINNNLGIIALLEDEVDKETALFYFTKILNKCPYYYPALVNRGILYLESGLFERALKDLEIAAEINSKDVAVMMAYGNAQRGAGQFDEAVEIFSKLVGHREGLYNLGLVYYEDLKDWKKADKTFGRYLESGSTFGKNDMAETYYNKTREKLSNKELE